MGFEKQTEEIREICRKLFTDGTVDVILAHTEGVIDDAPIPFIAKNAEDVDKIIRNDRIKQNLAPYLHGRTDRAGIVATPCDARAIVQYINENQLVRENIYIIGVDCPGMEGEDGDARPGCPECTVRVAPVCDARVEDDRAKAAAETAAAAALVADADTGAAALSPAEKLARFRAEIDKCILCYSCRQACYACYCKTCFIDRDMPDWQPAEPDAGAKMAFHLGRYMHLAGRCVECGACEAACASGVNVRYIIKELTEFVDETYGFKTGMEIGPAQAMVKYDQNDPETGFIGEAHHE